MNKQSSSSNSRRQIGRGCRGSRGHVAGVVVERSCACCDLRYDTEDMHAADVRLQLDGVMRMILDVGGVACFGQGVCDV